MASVACVLVGLLYPRKTRLYNIVTAKGGILITKRGERYGER